MKELLVLIDAVPVSDAPVLLFNRKISNCVFPLIVCAVEPLNSVIPPTTVALVAFPADQSPQTFNL